MCACLYMYIHLHVLSSFSKDQALSVRSGLILCKSIDIISSSVMLMSSLVRIFPLCTFEIASRVHNRLSIPVKVCGDCSLSILT